MVGGGMGLMRTIGAAAGVGLLLSAACLSEPTVVPATPTPGLTPTAVPQQPPTPTPVSSPSPAPTPTPASAAEGSYRNSLYGFVLDLPQDWTATEETDQPSQAAVFETGIPDVTAQAIVVYYADRLKASEAAQQELAPLAGLAGFRVITESPFALPDGAEGYQALYGFGTGSNEQRGGLVFAVRGTQAVVAQVVGPRIAYERNLDLIEGFLTSLRVEPPSPFGIPRDQALTLALDSGPYTLDPALAQESQSIQYIRQVFGGLVALDQELNVVPDLADWEVSADGLTYTFRISPDARFHDGRPVTAADVVYSWERAARPETGSQVAMTYLGDIAGMAEVARGAAEHASGLAAVDERTLRVAIGAPRSYFLAKLTHTVASVVDRQDVETDAEEEWWRTPNATGPFILADWAPGKAMHLRRDPDYHGVPAQVEHVVFRFYTGDHVRMLEDDEIDAAILSANDVRNLRAEDNPLADEVIERSQLSVQFVGFNTAVAPFDDLNVRRAFLLAIDRQRLLEGDLEGIGELATGIIPPGMPGHDDAAPPIAFSPAEAQALLLTSDYGSAEALPDIVFSVPGGLSVHHLRLAEMWRDNLGVQIQAEVLPASAYYYDLKSNIANLYDYGWIADYPDPHNFLYDLFHSSSENNVGGFSDPDVDALLERAQGEQDQTVRMDLYRQAERMIVARAAVVPLWYMKERYIVQDGVAGFLVSPQGTIDLRTVSLEREPS